MADSNSVFSHIQEEVDGMAKLWPEKIPFHIRKNPKRSAEVRVFKELAKVLDDNFHVFYSTPWLKTDHNGNEKDGECDFLIAHPENGILAIEVKGGMEISYDPSTFRWTLTGHNGQKHTIKDPVQQALESKHVILKKLNASRGWNNRPIYAAHGVILPTIGRIPHSLGPSRPAKVFCCSREFREDLRGWIGKRMNEANKQTKDIKPLGQDGISALKKLLVRPFSLSYNIGSAIAEANDEFNVLAPSQYQVLTYIPQISRVLIQGGAGTGKTVLAIELAIRLAQEGKKVLLTCYSRPLAEETRLKLRNFARITVRNFHSLCGMVVRQVGCPDYSQFEERELYDQILPNELYKTMEANPSMKWDAVIVDEGQDIKDEWWVSLDSCLKEGGELRVFMDSNQKIYSGSRRGGSNMDAVPIPLTTNLRNTQPIHEAASVHYSGTKIESGGPNGLDVEWILANDGNSKVKYAIKKLKKLVSTEEVAAHEIAVLVNSSEVKDKVLNLLEVRDVPLLSDAVNLGFKDVVVETVRRFKGLERPAVILIVDGRDMQQHELAYVAFSRAKAYLCVVCSKREQGWLQDSGEKQNQTLE